MGLPKIEIIFKEKTTSFIRRGTRGVVALVLKDAQATGQHHLYSLRDIPEKASDKNRKFIQMAFTGYVTAPKKVIVCFEKEAIAMSQASFNYLERTRFDYLAVPEATAQLQGEIATWVKSLYDTKEKKVKFVAANIKGDHRSIINFTSTELNDGVKTWTPLEYTARIAGLIAGTPPTISCTFAPLPELLTCKPLTKDQIDQKIDAGELIVFDDGAKVKVARGVNSFTTTNQDLGDSFKKIKIVEVTDLIHEDIKTTVEDSYLGKYANSYDNKCLLVSTIQGYFEGLEQEGLLERGKSVVKIDLEAQRAFLKGIGYKTLDGRFVEDMDDKEIREADTKDKVFLIANIVILDAIEEIRLPIMI